MTTTPDTPDRPRRSAAEVNEEIRALWLSTGGYLRPEQHLEYERLVAEWAEATATAATHSPVA
ncbi:hypothetical protein ACGFSB_09600 [Streptomyces sp. NPDC048441]|uniref:hypothetical protein n=1 Tax=Streptomyces sp. NPDC048441 TaxID=3365552 RepID=UPI0037190C03